MARHGDFARQLGVSAGYLSKLRKRAWWPTGEQEWELSACLAAIKSHVARKGGTPAAPPAGGVTTGTAPKLEHAPELLTALEDASDPLAMTRAALKLQAQTMAHGFRTGTSGARDADHLKKLLEELRVSESSWMALQVRRGELVERTVAAEVGAEVAQRAVRCMTILASGFAAQVEVWLADRGFVELNSDERKRLVMEWSEGQVRTSRLQEHDEISKMLEERAG